MRRGIRLQVFPMEEGDDYTFDIIGHTEEGMLDGITPVQIMRFNGKTLTEGVQGADNVYLAEWSSLERGKHELETVLMKKDGSEERLAVEFNY